MSNVVQFQPQETPPCLIPTRAFSAYGYDVLVYLPPAGVAFDGSGWAAEIEGRFQSLHDRLGPFSSAGEAVLFALDWCREHPQDDPLDWCQAHQQDDLSPF